MHLEAAEGCTRVLLVAHPTPEPAADVLVVEYFAGYDVGDEKEAAGLIDGVRTAAGMQEESILIPSDEGKSDNGHGYTVVGLADDARNISGEGLLPGLALNVFVPRVLKTIGDELRADFGE